MLNDTYKIFKEEEEEEEEKLINKCTISKKLNHKSEG